MEEQWRVRRLGLAVMIWMVWVSQLVGCRSLNEEDFPMCSWFGVRCWDEEPASLKTTETNPALSRRFLRVTGFRSVNARNDESRIAHRSSVPSPAPNPSLPTSEAPAPLTISGPDSNSNTPNVSASSPSASGLLPSSSRSKKVSAIILLGIFGGILVVAIPVTGIVLKRNKKEATVEPWATGLSGQLQKAFVTGVPNLKRSELETACEDFSNVVGRSSVGMVFKGTLSTGVEIAVTSITVKAAKDWTKSCETKFRKKISALSKVNHKNFVNLIGYCEEDEPFTRMMVFEYAPNGTLFEHLHTKEAEHLDWTMRLRIAMGLAYCLEHMHKLTPPVAHSNLNSLVVNLSEDYAAKLSDFSFSNDGVAATELGSLSFDLLNTQLTWPESNVYSFGLILFEMVTGRLPYSRHYGSVEGYLRGYRPLNELLDPTLDSFQEDHLEKIGELIKSCLHSQPEQRPTMTEATAVLREITTIGPDGAIPRLSPLWWAELEVLSFGDEN